MGTSLQQEDQPASPSWLSEPCMLGVDEAGRGPVLGPMVYGIAYCPIAAKDLLAGRAFADSKTLTEEVRETLFEEIQDDASLGCAVDVLTAKAISGKMLQREKVSLNAIANDSTYKLIADVLQLGVNLQQVFVDTVGDAGKYQERLAQKFPGIEFTVCPKADALYPIVSAASIVAKVTRDRLLRDFAVEEAITVGDAFGSGYPGDPDTKAWMEAHMNPMFGYPTLVRFSWATCSRILDEKAVAVTWECDDENLGQQTLQFKPSPMQTGRLATSGAGRHSYFRARKLQCAAAF